MFGFIDLPACNGAQLVGADDGVGRGAQHELEAPHNFGFGHIRQRGEQRVAVALEHVGVFLGEQRADEV
ncbi:hypothetical protein D3C74_502090 [compost metagenome]